MLHTLRTQSVMVKDMCARINEMGKHSAVYKPIFLRACMNAKHQAALNSVLQTWNMMIASCQVELENLTELIEMPEDDRGSFVSALVSSIISLEDAQPVKKGAALPPS